MKKQVSFNSVVQEITLNSQNAKKYLDDIKFIDVAGLTIKINTLNNKIDKTTVVSFSYDHPLLIKPIRLEKNRLEQFQDQYEAIVDYFQNGIEPVCKQFANLQAQLAQSNFKYEIKLKNQINPKTQTSKMGVYLKDPKDNYLQVASFEVGAKINVNNVKYFKKTKANQLFKEWSDRFSDLQAIYPQPTRLWIDENFIGLVEKRTNQRYYYENYDEASVIFNPLNRDDLKKINDWTKLDKKVSDIRELQLLLKYLSLHQNISTIYQHKQLKNHLVIITKSKFLKQDLVTYLNLNKKQSIIEAIALHANTNDFINDFERMYDGIVNDVLYNNSIDWKVQDFKIEAALDVTSQPFIKLYYQNRLVLKTPALNCYQLLINPINKQSEAVLDLHADNFNLHKISACFEKIFTDQKQLVIQKELILN